MTPPILTSSDMVDIVHGMISPGEVLPIRRGAQVFFNAGFEAGMRAQRGEKYEPAQPATNTYVPEHAPPYAPQFAPDFYTASTQYLADTGVAPAEAFRSGGGGDFAGAGASRSWESPSTESASSSSSESSSSDSSSSSSSSSDSGSCSSSD